MYLHIINQSNSLVFTLCGTERLKMYSFGYCSDLEMTKMLCARDNLNLMFLGQRVWQVWHEC